MSGSACGGERSTSGITTRLILNFVQREAGPAAVGRLLRLAELEPHEPLLRDEHHWHSWQTKVRLLEAAAVVLEDPRVGLRLGAAALTSDVGRGVKLAARALGGPRLLFAHAERFASKFATTHRFEVHGLGARHAVLGHRDVSGVGYDRRDCDYNIGLLRAAPELFGLPPAHVEHVACGVDGAAACLYRVHWSARDRGRATAPLALAVTSASTVTAALAAGPGLPAAVGLLAVGAVIASARAARVQRDRANHLSQQLDAQQAGGERAAADVRSLGGSGSVRELAHQIGQGGQAAVGGHDFVILLHDGAGSWSCAAASQLTDEDRASLLEWAATRELPTERTLVLDDLAAEAALSSLSYRSLCASVLQAQQRRLGVLVVLARGPRAFGGYDTQLLHDYAPQAAIALANTQLSERIKTIATRDPITDLLNEHGIGAAIDRELGGHAAAPLAVAVIRLTDLPVSADGSREQSDRLLQQAAQSLQASIDTRGAAAGARIARLVGSHFAIMLPARGATSALSEVDAHCRALSQTLGLSASGGIALAPAHARDAASLLRLAHAALPSISTEPAATTIYDPLTHPTAAIDSEQRAITAILTDPEQLTVHVQPIIDAVSGEVVAYEALSRFSALPQRPPDVWFAMAHRAGLGPALEALAAARALAHPGRPPGTRLNLNASPAALCSHELWQVLPEDLTGIVIEITEQQAYSASGELERALQRVRERGGKIALDDAGSGWSGLQQLIRIAPDIVKLDRSLVSDLHHRPANQALINALARFAHRTGATVCAEGVEIPAELTALQQLGVDLAQGWLIARPTPHWTNAPLLADHAHAA